ncbi:hypothetical protein SAMN04488134_108102 [Amphibacillus marinus]|uniref:Uncharacterized protein n=1 Tax=Amphibacillus marinus TaxID=872970 RepID=A0A1H8QBE8_9BACI|nr:hypothetical protein [Amphibacillus marinus]SEO51331.1 hypothetical protein SAMN04488134_108102 [Amphibacillus marinus]
MAEEKKVIKVNDLIIQAENVHFESVNRPQQQSYDPFPFFGRRPVPEQVEVDEQTESTVEAKSEAGAEPEETPRRHPFSWI